MDVFYATIPILFLAVVMGVLPVAYGVARNPRWERQAAAHRQASGDLAVEPTSASTTALVATAAGSEVAGAGAEERLHWAHDEVTRLLGRIVELEKDLERDRGQAPASKAS